MDKFYTFFNPPKAHLEGNFDPLITRQEGYRKTEAIINDFIRAGQVLTASYTGQYDLLEGEDTEDMSAPVWRSRRFDEVDLQDYLESRETERRRPVKSATIVGKGEINRNTHAKHPTSEPLDLGKSDTKIE